MKNRPIPVTRDFAAQTASARRILVVEIAGLGDLVHSLPSMWALRQAWPDAELHCLVRAEYASLLGLTPWVDRVWPYPRGRAGLGEITRLVRDLREQRFDVAIDLMGSNHASCAAWLSGASRRLVRRPGVRKPRFAWRWCSTDLMEQPFTPDRMYIQRWKCLRQAGLAAAAPRFEFGQPLGLERVPALADLAQHFYLHLSPCTRLASKELPPAQLVELVGRLRKSHPHLKIVISSGGRPRELAVLADLLKALPVPPWKIFAGTLEIPQLFRLIQGASLHLGGDTGSMHLAWLAGTPSVCWMSPESNHRAWAPDGDQHALIRADAPPRDYLYGVSTGEIIAQALERGSVRGPIPFARPTAPACASST